MRWSGMVDWLREALQSSASRAIRQREQARTTLRKQVSILMDEAEKTRRAARPNGDAREDDTVPGAGD